MTLTVPEYFTKVSNADFWNLLQDINWLREAYSGGEIMVEAGTKIRVAIHTEPEDCYYVNRDYFKPVG